MSEKFDLVVIGAGPGGYLAALRAAGLGMKVVVVEKRAALGGVCLNEGCIPSKALLDSSEYFTLARDSFSNHGIEVGTPQLDLHKMMARKDELVKRLADGISYMFKKDKVQQITGTASLLGADAEGIHQVQITDANGDKKIIFAAKVLLATGSEPVPLPGLPFNGKTVISSREALELDKVPKHLVVVGAGAIGLELGSVWRRLGAEVTVLEMLPEILPNMDKQVATGLQRSLKKQQINVKTGAVVLGTEEKDGGLKLRYKQYEEEHEIDCDAVLVSIGRCPALKNLELEKLGVQLLDNGRIKVDENYQTNLANLYAIGDIVAGPMLAHKASEEAIVVVERMSGKDVAVNYGCIPAVVYTAPEAASVGQSEEQLKHAKIPYKTGLFNFMNNGRARAFGETDGFVKIIADATTDRLLGVHIVGPRASDLIAEAVAVMTLNGTSRDIAYMVHAHPTFSEVMKEAALVLHGKI